MLLDSCSFPFYCFIWHAALSSPCVKGTVYGDKKLSCSVTDAQTHVEVLPVGLSTCLECIHFEVACSQCLFFFLPPLQCFLLSRARLLLNLCSRFLASCNFFTLADIGWLLHSSLSLLGGLILLLCWLLHETTRTLCWENCMGAVDF